MPKVVAKSVSWEMSPEVRCSVRGPGDEARALSQAV